MNEIQIWIGIQVLDSGIPILLPIWYYFHFISKDKFWQKDHVCKSQMSIYSFTPLSGLASFLLNGEDDTL